MITFIYSSTFILNVSIEYESICEITFIHVDNMMAMMLSIGLINGKMWNQTENGELVSEKVTNDTLLAWISMRVNGQRINTESEWEWEWTNKRDKWSEIERTECVREWESVHGLWRGWRAVRRLIVPVRPPWPHEHSHGLHHVHYSVVHFALPHKLHSPSYDRLIAPSSSLSLLLHWDWLSGFNTAQWKLRSKGRIYKERKRDSGEWQRVEVIISHSQWAEERVTAKKVNIDGD